jgi:hypothetical protein
MSELINRQGQVFGQWTVVEHDVRTSKRKHATYWYCECSCGVLHSVLAHNLVSGKSTSCGHSQYKTGVEHPAHIRSQEKVFYKGSRHGALEVVAFHSFTKCYSSVIKEALYLCRCVVCGHERLYTQRALRTCRTLSTQRCGVCSPLNREPQKATAADILAMRRMYAPSGALTLRQIADIFNVSESFVSLVVRDKRRTNVGNIVEGGSVNAMSS